MPVQSSFANTSCAVHASELGRANTSWSLDCVEEEAVAFRYNGFPHGVMMATPADLEDFAVGFSLAEGVIAAASDVDAMSVAATAEGISVDISLRGESLRRYLAGRRVRQLRGHTSCGLCGVEDLRDVRNLPARVHPAVLPEEAAISRAFDRLREWQPLSRLTRGAHAAAWVDVDGAIRIVREDVGRHNALDKLIGAGLRGAFSHTRGFCLVTSRCSFEMVQKAVAADFAVIVSASAPTALAIRTAKAAGLALCALSRDRAPLIFTQHEHSEDSSWQPNAS
ncbi:formate dehydrogenase accessory sulfurtransferase FdhD [Bradyrhizobium sp. WSM 1704]|uniref:formate dehydrogenase accessory sulfurtransferase FdhD n=1 Tax=Bradyrhizobium semiaridum TaxID=2821404 RepID=UPI001CE245CF|nr:formate dehydrogenase accessory sulfurtransferase FdhD [Bradyrhizobium semiaridum]MCA6124409.1 formate dehydrogenase accessory sulfurtransferase FdhD [Bradyrhizobium semiaridum]